MDAMQVAALVCLASWRAAHRGSESSSPIFFVGLRKDGYTPELFCQDVARGTEVSVVGACPVSFKGPSVALDAYAIVKK